MADLLLTGATGYLGTAVLREFLGSDYRVRVLVRDPNRLVDELRTEVSVHEGDLFERDSLMAAAAGADGIIHVAGLATDWAEDPLLYDRVNADGTSRVLEAAKKAGVGRVVCTSSVMALGPTGGTQRDETAPLAAGRVHPYVRSKSAAVRICREARGAELDVLIAYPGALYGAGPRTEGNYVGRVISDLRDGLYPCLPRLSGQRWCFAHVDDVARGHRLIWERGGSGGEYILGGDNVPFDLALEIIRKSLSKGRLPPRVPGVLMMAGLRIIGLVHRMRRTRPQVSPDTARSLLCDWHFSSDRAVEEIGYTFRGFESAFGNFVDSITAIAPG